MSSKLEENNDSDFDNQIELGTMHEKSGDIDKGIVHYKNAYDIAVILEDEKYQVDSLVKIIEAYFYKGEIEDSLKYAELAQQLLGNIDYVKGKLDISLYLLKVYSKKNEYYKAREIGNEAIKLCSEEYIIYKGRILNALANLYWEMTDANEHIALLNQALECFEKANLLRGILGILNNIGVVYAEKLQNNEKALEYFFEIKQRSEDINHSEFNVFAYINIGETYFKCLKYEEALYWSKLALQKAEETQLESMVFYAYVILSSVYLKLNNYKEAYDYFNLATMELQNYPDQGSVLTWYYKSAARLFLEFGEINKARYNIKQALDMLGSEESIIKWDTGIIYEFINLKAAKNKTEILDAVEGITYILLKYKNPQVILDKVYEAALEIIDLGQKDLAFKLVDEYKYMVAERKDTMLSRRYMEALKLDNEEREQLLNEALELAVETKNNKIYIKICRSLGEYYCKVGNYEKSISYYADGSRQVENMVMSVPEEFKIGFSNLYKIT
jgi:tetratricopeptide (TPR) repeat protein